MRKPRSEMIAETRTKLMAAGRKAFGTVGYAGLRWMILQPLPG